MWASALFLWGEISGRGSMTDAGGGGDCLWTMHSTGAQLTCSQSLSSSRERSSLSVWGRWIWSPLRETPSTGNPLLLPYPPCFPWGWLWNRKRCDISQGNGLWENKIGSEWESVCITKRDVVRMKNVCGKKIDAVRMGKSLCYQ